MQRTTARTAVPLRARGSVVSRRRERVNHHRHSFVQRRAQFFWPCWYTDPVSYTPLTLQNTQLQSAVAPRRAAETEAEVDPRIKEMPKFRDRPDKYTGKCFVVKDNIDTDQIIPAEYLTLVPSKVTRLLCNSRSSCTSIWRVLATSCIGLGRWLLLGGTCTGFAAREPTAIHAAV